MTETSSVCLLHFWPNSLLGFLAHCEDEMDENRKGLLNEIMNVKLLCRLWTMIQMLLLFFFCLFYKEFHLKTQLLWCSEKKMVLLLFFLQNEKLPSLKMQKWFFFWKCLKNEQKSLTFSLLIILKHLSCLKYKMYMPKWINTFPFWCRI